MRSCGNASDDGRPHARSAHARSPRALRRHGAGRPPRLARHRRRRARQRRQRSRLRRGDRRRRPRLPSALVGAGRERAAWIVIGLGDPLLGGGRGLLDGVHRRRPLAALSLARPTSATSPTTRWPRAGLVLLVRARAHELDWRLWMDGADRRPRHRGARHRLRLRVHRRPDRRDARCRSRRPSPIRSGTSRCWRWSSASSR